MRRPGPGRGGPAASPAHPPGAGGPAAPRTAPDPRPGATESDGALVRLFDAAAPDYDRARRILVPGIDAFYDAAIGAVGALPEGARILDLGAGTGLLAARLALRRPDCRFVLADLSEPMLEVAGARFAALGLPPPATAAGASGDLRGPLPPGPFDAVISALAIHHLEHAGQRALFARVAALLPKGGAFVNAEQVAADDPMAEAAAVADWEAAVRAAGADAAMLEAAHARMAYDRCAPVADLLDWLREAGFEADCPWRGGRFAVLAGRRAVRP